MMEYGSVRRPEQGEYRAVRGLAQQQESVSRNNAQRHRIAGAAAEPYTPG